MVAVPVRAGPAFTAMVTWTSWDPLSPLSRMLIQGTLLVVVHAHPAGAVTLMVFVSPSAPTLWTSGEIVIVQPAACAIVNVWPAMVRVPDRDPPVCAAAVNATLPGPLPVVPDVMVNQLALLAAVHGQEGPAVMPTAPAPP